MKNNLNVKLELITKLENNQPIERDDLKKLNLFNDNYINLLMQLDRISLKLKIHDVFNRKSIEWY